MKNTITTNIEKPTDEQWLALSSALRYISDYAKVLADDPETAEDNFMGAFNAGGFPSQNPGQVEIRLPDERDFGMYDVENDEEIMLMIDWPDGYSYPVLKRTFESAVAYEVREA